MILSTANIAQTTPAGTRVVQTTIPLSAGRPSAAWPCRRPAAPPAANCDPAPPDLAVLAVPTPAPPEPSTAGAGALVTTRSAIARDVAALAHELQYHAPAGDVRLVIRSGSLDGAHLTLRVNAHEVAVVIEGIPASMSRPLMGRVDSMRRELARRGLRLMSFAVQVDATDPDRGRGGRGAR